ncbi:hypothetical protein [Haloferula sp.]|uniref:hypothetical protein n=1 Tax=Haloferula sp. TaxID=2497595 RepID=UPI00329CB846
MAIGEKLLDIRDDVAIKLITKAAEKKDRVNAELKENGVKARITSFELQPGVPPSIVFCVDEVSDDSQ